MTQEDKQLLIKDLCARLPYGVKAICDVSPNEMFDELRQNDGRECFIDINSINGDKIEFRDEEEYVDWWMPICYIRPYLRPMSSMTEEEYKELYYTIRPLYDGKPYESEAADIDFFNVHHFDYRGLIEKGLALEALEGMYKTE